MHRMGVMQLLLFGLITVHHHVTVDSQANAIQGIANILGISEEELKEFIKEAKELGLDQQSEPDLPKLDAMIEEKLEHFKTQPFKLAVTGATGTGKSTLINTLRGLTAQEKGAAKVDIVETTDRVQAYNHPDLPNYTLYDVPGVNSPTFRMSTYVNDIEFKSYDCIIICAKDRFTETDVWLAKQAKHYHIPYVFVRTQINMNLLSATHDDGADFNEQESLKKMQQNIKKQLIEHKLPGNAVFLISGRLKDIDKWDYPKFMTHLHNQLPKEVKEAFIMSLKAASQEVIIMIKNQFEKRIPQIARYAAIAEKTSGTGASYLEKEYQLYQKHLGVHHHGIPNTDTYFTYLNMLILLAVAATLSLLISPFALLGFLPFLPIFLGYLAYYSPFKNALVDQLSEFTRIALARVREDTT